MRNTYFGILLIAFLSITSATDVGAQNPSTAAPPQTIYYLTKAVWITIGGKDYGFGTGTQFELVQDSGNRVKVKNGNYEFEVDRNLLTNDYAVAKQAADTEIAQREAKARAQEKVVQAIRRREEAEQRNLAQQARTEQLLQEEQRKLRRAEQALQAASDLEAASRRTPQNNLIMRENEPEDEMDDQRNRSIQAQLDAQTARNRAEHAGDEMWGLEMRRNQVLQDERYEYNKAATERGNQATYGVKETFDRKIEEFDGKINDARNEQSYWENKALQAEQQQY